METAQQQLVETELLARLKAGDQAAFEHFYDKYRLQLYHKILKMVGIDIIAEELLQDLYVKIWQKRALINPEKSFKSYLYKIAENLIADHYRQAVYQLKIERNTDINTLELAEPGENPFPKDLALKAINEAFQTLPAQQQKVFSLIKIEGKSYEEVAKLLDINHATINTHMSRAVKQIKEYIKIHHGSALGLAMAAALLELARQAAA